MGPIQVHLACVAAALRAADNATETEGLAEALRANSGELAAERVEAGIAEIGI